MFSSKHTYLLHQEAPNSGASTSMVNEILLQDMLSGHYPVTTDHSPPVLFNHDLLGHGTNGDPSSMAAHMCHKSAKKDRHSKIHTAQGPRDRRVRLSIGVARKFFDLQEMLGFDKPSKTLDWLLTKSKSAIRHLVHTKQPPPPGSSSVIIEEIINNYNNNNCNNNNDDGFVDDNYDDAAVNNNNNKLLKKKGKSVVTSNKKSKGGGGGGGGYKDAQQQAAMNQARESRVKARARARERTREKMCFKQQQMCGISNEYDQYMNNQLQEVCRISASGGGGGIMHHYDPAGVNDDLIQESNVIKRKHLVKHNNNNNNNNNNPSIFGFHPAVALGYGTDNWDITNFSSQSSLSAILDQHKFNIHSSSNNN